MKDLGFYYKYTNLENGGKRVEQKLVYIPLKIA